MTFTSYAQGGSFRPKKTTDYLPTLRENQKRQSRDEQIYFDQMRTNDQTKVKNAQRAGDGLEALGKFSGTLADVLGKQEKKRNEELEAEGAALFYEQGYPVDPQWEAEEAALKQADDVVNQTADAVYVQSEDPIAAEQIRELSGWKKYGYAKAAAEAAGQEYAPFLESSMQNSEVQFTDPNTGQVFTAQSAKPGAQQQAALSHFRKEYFKTRGIGGLNPNILAKYTHPEMRKREGYFLQQQAKAFGIAAGADQRNTAKVEFESDKNYGRLLERYATSLDKEGNRMGYARARDQLKSELLDMINAGTLDVTELDALSLQTTSDQPTVTFRDRFGDTYWEGLKKQARDARNTEFTRSERERSAAFTSAEDKFFETAMQDENLTDDEIAFMNDELFRKYGKRSKKLDDLTSVEEESADALDDYFEAQYQANSLSVEEVMKAPRKIRDYWLSRAQQQENANKATNNSRAAMDSIDGLVKAASAGLPDGVNAFGTEYVINDLTSYYNQRFREYQATMDPKAAELQAIADTRAYFEAGKATGGKFNTDAGKGYVNAVPAVSSSALGQAQHRYTTALDTLKAVGVDSFLESPEIIWSQPELEKVVKDYEKGKWTPSGFVERLSNLTKKSPLEILNAQLEASGMTPIEPPPAAAVIETIDPVYRELTQQFTSHRRAGRALQSIGEFKPELVPQGFGEAISNAGSKYDIPAGVLAGLLATESNFDVDAVSHAGAKGIAQFMPGTAQDMDVDVNDPMSSIDGAAKYLRWLMDTYDFDLETAIYAYNGGPGNVLKLGKGFDKNGSQENYLYFGKVMQNATRFGDRSAYEQGTLVRPGVLPLWQQRTSEIG